MYKRSEAAPIMKNQMGAASFREQPPRASSEAHMFHLQCGHDTALGWRDYRICGENEGKRAAKLLCGGIRRHVSSRLRYADDRGKDAAAAAKALTIACLHLIRLGVE